MSPTLEIPIRDETIRLGQLLKLAGVVDDGAQARELIENGEVTVDGEVDRRRGRQCAPAAWSGSATPSCGSHVRAPDRASGHRTTTAQAATPGAWSATCFRVGQ